MAKVLCTLPNASEEISGVKFATHDKGMLSEDISDEQAAEFAAIKGYELVGAAPKKTDAEVQAEKEAEAAAKAAEKAAKDAEKADLVNRAEAVSLTVKGNWSIERLRTEVEAAEKAKADAEAAAKAAADTETK